MFQVEAAQQKEADINLNDQIRDIHTRFGLAFPLDECAPVTLNCLDELNARAEVMPQVRSESQAAIARIFGVKSDEANAAKIVASIGNDFDRIFLSQLLHKGEPFRSWQGYDQEHSEHLTHVIDELTLEPSLAGYFEKNPETIRMLLILKELATSDDISVFDTLTSELENLAIAQYKDRRPTLLFLLSDWYMDPNRTDSYIQILEPDCRLILPYKDEIYDKVGRIVDAATRDLAVFYPRDEREEQPTGVIGEAVIWSGSQLVSYTVGEAFNGHGFVMAPNLLKTLASVRRVFDRAGLPVPDDMILGLIRQYVYHEVGHSYFHPNNRFMDELTTDTTTVISITQEALGKSDEELTSAIALLLGEYMQYVDTPVTGEANSDGYRISSILVTNKLLEYNLVQVGEDGRLHIHQDRARCLRFIQYLKELHEKLVAGNETTINELFLLTPSKKTLEVARS